jgi:hypothetical protein
MYQRTWYQRTCPYLSVRRFTEKVACISDNQRILYVKIYYVPENVDNLVKSICSNNANFTAHTSLFVDLQKKLRALATTKEFYTLKSTMYQRTWYQRTWAGLGSLETGHRARSRTTKIASNFSLLNNGDFEVRSPEDLKRNASHFTLRAEIIRLVQKR